MHEQSKATGDRLTDKNQPQFYIPATDTLKLNF